MKALWNDTLIADSENTIVVEGNHYFPPEDVNHEYLVESEKTSTCPWKGNAKYYSLQAAGKVNKDAAWYYPEPKKAAQKIAGYIAFWNGVNVTE